MFGPLLEIEMWKKCTGLWCKAHFEVKCVKNWRVQITFGSWDVEKVYGVVARSTFRSEKRKKLWGTERFWTFRFAFVWQAQGIVHLFRSEQNVRVLWHFQKRWQAWDIMTRICKDGFRVAGAVQETCWSEMLGGQAADFLRGVAFWSIRSSGLLRWFCVTGAALRMTWP